MTFSIVLATYLGNYPGAATNREIKLIRAIDSVLDQTEKDYELIIVADGCEKSFNLIKNHYKGDVNCFLIDKSPTFSGTPRNVGIKQAKGDYIVYIDNDDVFGKNHLHIIKRNLNNEDWVYFNDYVYRKNTWIERGCMIRTMGKNGTSNVCHKRNLRVIWGGGYAHDFYFNQQLQRYPKNKKIETPEYFVCHIPNFYDV